jgi:ABC-2 type transport system ATP-binding protein
MDSSIKELKYGYLNRKIIDVKYGVLTDASRLEGLSIVKSKGTSMKIEVNEKKESIQEIMVRLMQAGSILDVTISDIPMEKIIGDIYRDKGLEEPDAGIAPESSGQEGEPE